MQTPPPDFTTGQIVTSIISGLAFLLSIYSLYLQRKDKKPKLLLDARLGMRPIKIVKDNMGGWWYEDDRAGILTIRNPSEKAIGIRKIEFITEHGSIEIEPVPAEPVESNTSVEVVAAMKTLLIPMSGPYGKAYFKVEDSLGNTYKGKKRKFNFLALEGYFASENEKRKWLSKKAEREKLKAVDNSDETA